MVPSFLRKTVWGCNTGKRLFKRFISQKNREQFAITRFLSKCSKGSEVKAIGTARLLSKVGQDEGNIKAILVILFESLWELGLGEPAK